MLDQFSAAIEKLYAAAADGRYWPTALGAVEELTGSAGAVVHLVSKRAGFELVTLLGESAQAYFTAEHLAEWTRDYAPKCPRLAAASRLPDAPFYVDQMLLTEREMDLDPVYDWYGSYGLRYFIGSRLCHDDEVEIVWSLQRRREQGHAQKEDIDLFQMLKPHLARSLNLARTLGTLNSFKVFSGTIFQALPQAMFALDANGRVVFVNESATELMCSGSVISISQHHLRTASTHDQITLDALIAEATSPGTRTHSGWTRLSQPNGRLPYAVFVAPLRGFENEVAAATARVLVVVHDPAAVRCPKPQVLSSVYGLTETEARLASAIGGGHSLESAAASLNMQVATARSHLKSIFAKVGVNRQQDLVRLLTSLSSLLA